MNIHVINMHTSARSDPNSYKVHGFRKSQFDMRIISVMFHGVLSGGEENELGKVKQQRIAGSP